MITLTVDLAAIAAAVAPVLEALRVPVAALVALALVARRRAR